MNGLRAMLLMCSALLVPALVRGQVAEQAPELEQVGVEEHLNDPLPLDAAFRDHTGRNVRLGDYFDGKRPVVVTLAYHSCAVLCNLVMTAAVDGLMQVPWTVGQEFDFVSISIDPKDTPESAAGKRRQTMSKYGRGEGRGFHYLVGDQTEIDRVAKAIGFQYYYNKVQQQYAHAAVIMLATPEGRLARYLYGLQFAANDLRLGLLEASEGRSISTVERALIYCYRYDPEGKKYVVVATRVMQFGGALTVMGVAGMLGFFWRRELRRQGRSSEAPTSATKTSGQVAKP